MTLQILTSAQNPKVKLARTLAQRKGRQAAGLFLVEGTKLLDEALRWGWFPEQTFATQAWWDNETGSGPFAGLPGERLSVSEAVLAAIATTESPDPVVSLLRLPDISQGLEALKPQAIVVIAHKLQDPGNLGTIIRSADAAGADAVIVTDGTVDPFSPKAVRASMGSLFHLPVLRATLPAWREAQPDLPIYAMSLDGGRSLYEFDYAMGGAFLIGTEGAGLDPVELSPGDRRVLIPMFGHAESLNAAMAATVCLYEAARQRHARN